uniref:Uncharacterized protein n=2 Tax=Anthoceros TaxID=3233 RepID=A0A6M8B203_ANTPU|nr:hypothetical protein [Anthoceros punctatus]YP_009863184.1 hypothetical protein [Anthoceros agrestis]QKD76598.1 hypothetical protein [Anthoceros punctatus]QKD76640.1 hypothetical protein [Anthoceros agrestis]
MQTERSLLASLTNQPEAAFVSEPCSYLYKARTLSSTCSVSQAQILIRSNFTRIAIRNRVCFRSFSSVTSEGVKMVSIRGLGQCCKHQTSSNPGGSIYRKRRRASSRY